MRVAEPITDAAVLRPGGRLFETYRGLAHDIRRRVLAAQTAREREVRRAKPVRTVQAEQFTLFAAE